MMGFVREAGHGYLLYIPNLFHLATLNILTYMGCLECDGNKLDVINSNRNGVAIKYKLSALLSFYFYFFFLFVLYMFYKWLNIKDDNFLKIKKGIFVE